MAHLGISHGNGFSISDFLLLPLPHGHIDPVRMAVAHEEKITDKPGGIELLKQGACLKAYLSYSLNS